MTEREKKKLTSKSLGAKRARSAAAPMPAGGDGIRSRARRTVAPALSRWLGPGYNVPEGLLPEQADVLRAELRALLAVARAADDLSRLVYPPDVWTPDARPRADLGPGERAAKRLNAALARLRTPPASRSGGRP